MKTIRLLYPDFVSGGLETYYFGAHLLRHILPENARQKLFTVDIPAPDGSSEKVEDGISAATKVMQGIRSAQAILAREEPDKIITIGGNCIVSLAPFDYLHGRNTNVGIVWIDAHPDVSTPANGYPYAHAMVLGSLLGQGAAFLRGALKNPCFAPDHLLYVGLQDLHSYQRKSLDDLGVNYTIQTENFVSDAEIADFTRHFAKVLVHLDIDVLDEKRFHSTYFANPELVGDGAGGGRMTMQELAKVLTVIAENSDITALTLAEYLPFDEHRLHTMLSHIPLLTE